MSLIKSRVIKYTFSKKFFNHFKNFNFLKFKIIKFIKINGASIELNVERTRNIISSTESDIYFIILVLKKRDEIDLTS